MSQITHASLALSALCLAACTFITDATDRKIVDGPGDLTFTFNRLGVHFGKTLDVALVSEDDVLQGRARVILPSEMDPEKFPAVTLSLRRALPPGKNRILFYVDTNNDNAIGVQPNGNVDEHLWIREVPASGKGSFDHTIEFNPFSEDDFQGLNGDLVIDTPNPSAPLLVKACLAKLFKDAVKSKLEIRVSLSEEDREVAYFKAYPGDALSGPVRIEGVIDAPNMYKFDLFVDGTLKNSINLMSEVGKDLVVPALRWFPANAGQIAACTTPAQ